jgi:carbamoyltransferase
MPVKDWIVDQPPKREEQEQPMKTILGIHDGHNAAAALLVDGRVVGAVQEERLTGKKNQGGVPREAITDLLAAARVASSDIDRVALNGVYMSYDHWDRAQLSQSYEEAGGFAARFKEPLKGTMVDGIYQKSKAQRRANKLSCIGFDDGKIAPVVHHTAHAAAAYYGSGWKDKALVLTCDGSGDRLSATVNVAENGQIRRIASIPETDSIGRLYSMVTYYMGLMPLEHEYKVMGLAPYVGQPGKAKEQARLFADLFEFDPKNPLVWRRRQGVPSMYSAYDVVRKLLYRQRFDLAAAGLQQFVEDMLTQWVRNCVRETGIGRVACGGGVFMNVKANKEILELPEVEELFIFPSCGDETNSIVAAYWIYAQECLRSKGHVDIEPIGPIYWGRGFDDADVESVLKNFKARSPIQYKHVADIEHLTAQFLAKGEVVARAKGNMEFGARALGNRSILAAADNMQAVRVINDMVKNRDFWMPFAPAVLAERAEHYYVKPKPMFAPYMIIAFDSRPETRSKYPAGQHPYDYSVRPQEVCEEWNPDYYRLIKYYEELTGEAIILNTSFNLHGYPIVYRPAEALDVLDRSGLKFLALGNWWVWKD